MFERLDFIYTPTKDAAADVEYFTKVLGARLVFAVEGMGTRVAMVELTQEPPRILFAEHLDGERPVLVYRVENLREAEKDLKKQGWKREHSLEIPFGPVSVSQSPGGHRVALYELTRPEVEKHFEGRRDF